MSPRDKRCHRPGSTLVPQQPGASGTHRASTLVTHFATFQTWPEIQHTGPDPGAENVAGELRPRRNVICSPSGIETLVTGKSPRFTHSGNKAAEALSGRQIALLHPPEPEGTALLCLALGDYIHRHGLKPLLLTVSENRPALDNPFPSAGREDGGLGTRLMAAIPWID
ncbi:hypothetical protein AUP68_15132 [Ilyonectria robusta]